MLWKNQRQSDNIEDQRGGIGGGAIAAGGGGCGTVIIIILALIFGVDPRQFLDQSQSPQPQQTQTQTQNQRPNKGGNADEQGQFVGAVLGSTEDVWKDILPQQLGKKYRAPKLVLFTKQVRSACGKATSATGPFYCPGDEKVYLDTSFFADLQNEFRAPGDFARAYVIAHEIGHHVQQILGTSAKVDRAQQNARSEAEANQYSVRLELQADFYAGVWTYYAQKKGLVEAGDIDEALRAASAVGDDSIQKAAQGYVVPDSFTHGTSQQRAAAFKLGYQSGDLKQGNTFFAR